MKKLIAIILSFVYLGYVTGMTISTYNSGSTPCSDNCTTGNNYYGDIATASDNCSHYENHIGSIITLHHHVSATGKVKQPRSQSYLLLLSADPASLPEHVNGSLLWTQAEPLVYSIPVFLKNRVLRL